jgi:hypothetical protein
MPAKSQAQRAYIFQKFGKTWAEKHHFANKGQLPAKVKSAQPKPKAKGK